MKFFETFFLKQNRWIVFGTVFIVIRLLLSLLGLEDRYFYEQKGGVTTQMNIGHPVRTLVTFSILSIWLWTIANYFNNQLAPSDKQNISKLSKVLIVFLLLLAIVNITAYTYAEAIFHNDFLILFALVIIIPFTFYLYSAWFTIEIIKAYFKGREHDVLLFPWGFLNVVLFPFSLWKLQRIVNDMYCQQGKIETQ